MAAPTSLPGMHVGLLVWDDNNGVWVPAKADSTGALASTVITGDIEIGAVEIKNASSDDRLSVDSGGALLRRGYAFDVTVTPTVSNGAYSAGDIVGALMTFAVARVADEPVIINRVQVGVKAAVTSALTLILFSADPTGTTKTDNAAYSLAAADTFKVICALPISSLGGYLTDHGTPNTYELNNLCIPAKPASGTVNIFGLLIDGTGWTLTSTSDIQVRIAGTGP